MEQDQLNKIIEQNPNIDLSTLERSRQIDEIFAEMGIKLGGYRLAPPLGGSPLDLRSIFDQRVR